MSTTKPKQHNDDPHVKPKPDTKAPADTKAKQHKDAPKAKAKDDEEQHDDVMQPMSVRPTPEEERSQLQDPRTSTSSGDPPAEMTPAGERLGSRI